MSGCRAISAASQNGMATSCVRAAASAVSRCAVQIATTSTPGTARHAGRWACAPHAALMMPTRRVISSGVDGGELDVELVEAAQHPRRFVDEPTSVGWTVVFLGQADVPHTVEDAVEADARFGSCERPAGAGVDPTAEGDVRAHVRAVESELRGALELARGAVGGPVEQHDGRARRDRHVAELGGAR